MYRHIIWCCRRCYRVVWRIETHTMSCWHIHVNLPCCCFRFPRMHCSIDVIILSMLSFWWCFSIRRELLLSITVNQSTMHRVVQCHLCCLDVTCTSVVMWFLRHHHVFDILRVVLFIIVLFEHEGITMDQLHNNTFESVLGVFAMTSPRGWYIASCFVYHCIWSEREGITTDQLQNNTFESLFGV